ncbi:MAG: hypothetical protein HY075_00810 [Deltaproteobacteria bacterium]|nr:hypothetical protein [Deltaproteobacteria bacterium]
MNILRTALLFVLTSASAHAANVDLIVQSIAHNSSTNQVEVTVANQGTDSLPGSYHYLYLYAGSGSVYRYVPVPSAGTTQVIGVNLSELGSGFQVGSTYYMYAYADYMGYVAETNENNNALSAYVWIRGTSQPEFRVSSISDVANSPNVAITYANNGTASSVAPMLQISSGANVVNVSGAALGAGASATINVSKASLGLVLNATNSITAVVDSTNLVAEGDEFNNTLTSSIYVTAPVTLPDYQVTAVALDSTNTKINVTYFNAGASTSTYSYLMLNIGSVYKLAYVPGLAQNASATYAFNVSDFAMTGGNFYFALGVADYYGYITESSESNNSKSVTLSLPVGSGGGGGGSGGLPDLTVQDVTVSYGSIGVVVKNLGGAATGGFYVYISGNSRTYYTYVGSPGLAAGETRTIWMSSSNLGWYGGTIPIYAEADHWNYVPESNESNNTLSKSVTYNSGP